MRWLITGGCGFIGTNLADNLLSRNEEVVLLDNLMRAGSRDNLAWLRARHRQRWAFHEMDVRDADAIARLVKDIQPGVIAHLAGQVAVTTSLASPRLDFETNALGSFNVLEAVRLGSPDAIVLYSSTNKVYGALEHLRYEETATRYMMPDFPMGVGEDFPIEGHSPYGCSKLTADQYMRDYYRMYGIRTVVFRHSSMYGSRQFATFDQGWIGWFCQKALEMTRPDAAPFTISGTGKQVRDVLHGDDLIQAYLLAAARPADTAGQIYNVGGGTDNSLSLLELFAALEKIVGCRMRYTTIDWRPGDQRYFAADTRKAERDFSWRPQVGWAKGITGMCGWIRDMEAISR